jgi:MFS transporter, PPP family, 3-phenylpropionic acid transporter
MTSRHWASLNYFLYFAAAAALLPYLNLFYRSVGIPNGLIGILAGLTTLTSIIAGPLWAGLADALHIHRRILPTAILATLPVVAVIAFLRQFSSLAAGILVFGLCVAPIIPLIDNAVIQNLGEARSDYGRLRLWGAVGWGLSAWAAGLLIERFGMGVNFGMYILLMSICAWAATHLPAPAVRVVSEPFWTSLRRFARTPAWLIFLAAVFLVGISTSTIQNFLSLFVKDLGAGEGFFGLSMAISSLSEIPVFFLSTRWLRRFGARNLVIFAMAVFALRTLLLAFIHEPAWIIPIQLMHGLSFSALWAAGVNYSAQLAPPNLGATAQSVFSGMFMGLSGAAGAIGGGWMYGQYGISMMFLAASLLALTGITLFVLTGQHMQPESATTP